MVVGFELMLERLLRLETIRRQREVGRLCFELDAVHKQKVASDMYQ